MLVNNENGTLELKDLDTQLYRGMSLDQLKQTGFYREKYHNMWDVKTGYFWYYFKAIEVEGYQLSFSLCFWEDQLHSIHMNTWESTDAIQAALLFFPGEASGRSTIREAPAALWESAMKKK